MGIFSNLAQQSQPNLIDQIRQNPRAYVAQLKQDPVGFLRQCGINIPNGLNNPQQIYQHILQSGQRQMPRR